MRQHTECAMHWMQNHHPFVVAPIAREGPRAHRHTRRPPRRAAPCRTRTCSTPRIAPASAWHTRPQSKARRVSTKRWIVTTYSLRVVAGGRYRAIQAAELSMAAYRVHRDSSPQRTSKAATASPLPPASPDGQHACRHLQQGWLQPAPAAPRRRLHRVSDALPAGRGHQPCGHVGSAEAQEGVQEVIHHCSSSIGRTRRSAIMGNGNSEQGSQAGE